MKELKSPLLVSMLVQELAILKIGYYNVVSIQSIWVHTKRKSRLKRALQKGLNLRWFAEIAALLLPPQISEMAYSLF
jgi:hypothetical protein